MTSEIKDQVEVSTAIESTPDTTAPVKKQRRRKNKQQSSKTDDPDSVKVQEVVERGPEVPEHILEELQKNAYLETMQKRIRNLQKRKQRLDKYGEQAATPGAASLNQDQIAALKSKDQVIYPLKELEDLTKSFKAIDEEVQVQRIKEAKNHVLEIQAAATQAKKEAENEAHEKMKTLVKFLHVASWKRQFGSNASSQDENKAFENLLSLIYLGDESAVEAAEKLSSGVDEPVDAETSFTYSKIKKLSHELLEELYAKAQYEEAAVNAPDDSAFTEDPVVVISKPTEEDEDDEPISSVIKIPRGGLSFLNESELEIASEGLIPPPQTMADDIVLETSDFDPPAASMVDDLHANVAAATEWDTPTPEPVVAPLQPVEAEPVWEQAGGPDKPTRASGKPLANVTNNGRNGRSRGNGPRSRGGYANGGNNQNGGGERRQGNSSNSNNNNNRGSYRRSRQNQGQGQSQNQNQGQQSQIMA
ncbi:hypothetical protein V1512DRAFT_262200 [Lipomyces arxii]|uniref:uncharacterized protein n=1 Tax=Lipomyces arxii TaxID=56418 RepID=UPI0034CEC623